MSVLMHQFPSAFLKKYLPRFLPQWERQRVNQMKRVDKTRVYIVAEKDVVEFP